MPGQSFLALGDDVLIFLRNDEILWLPRRAFSSPDAIDSFLHAAQSHYANAMSRLTDRTVSASDQV
jgi:hypothetical protein